MQRLMLLALTLAALVISEPANAQVASINGPQISLSGTHKFHVGDNLQWAEPAFDDGDWQDVPVPGLWSDLGIAKSKQAGWYRIKFTYVADQKIVRPAFAGYLLHQDEIYLNGTKIGGFGSFAIFGKSPRPDVPHGRFRVYEIPDGLLLEDQENVLAVRLNRQAVVDEGGIPDYFFGLTDYNAATAAKADASKVHWLTDGVLFGMNLFIACILLVLILLKFRNTTVVSLFVLISALLLNNLSESHFIFDAGIFSPTLREFRNGMTCIATVMLLEFSAAILKHPLGKVGRCIQIVIVVSFLPYHVLAGELSDASIAGQKRLILVALLSAAIWIIYASVIAIRQGQRIGWFMLIGYGMTIALPSLVSLYSQGALLEISLMLGRWPHNVTTQIFMFSLSGVMAFQLHQTETERILANNRAMRAQLDERKRIARDMHDSIGQWLGSIKLRFQRIQTSETSGDIDQKNAMQELIGDMDVLIDDTRRIAHDLSPGFIAKTGLATALETHLKMLVEDHGIIYDLSISDNLGLAERSADHVYRIVQEATHNAITHGHARQIKLTLNRKSSGKLHIEIEDDGTGFETNSEKDAFSMGLNSIRERAEILGMKCSIESSSRQGSLVRIFG